MSDSNFSFLFLNISKKFYKTFSNLRVENGACFWCENPDNSSLFCERMNIRILILICITNNNAYYSQFHFVHWIRYLRAHKVLFEKMYLERLSQLPNETQSTYRAVLKESCNKQDFCSQCAFIRDPPLLHLPPIFDFIKELFNLTCGAISSHFNRFFNDKQRTSLSYVGWECIIRSDVCEQLLLKIAEDYNSNSPSTFSYLCEWFN